MNSRFSDPKYLRECQYKDASNLDQRVSLHERFSTNPQGWHSWVFAQLDPPPFANILEVGCGPGRLWAQNQSSFNSGWRVILSDFSPGMLANARERLLTLSNLSFACFDAQDPPFPAGFFDIIIANHILYHVPDVDRAIAELHRILKPGGKLIATTNGQNHLRELREFVDAANQTSPYRTPCQISIHQDNHIQTTTRHRKE